MRYILLIMMSLGLAACTSIAPRLSGEKPTDAPDSAATAEAAADADATADGDADAEAATPPADATAAPAAPAPAATPQRPAATPPADARTVEEFDTTTPEDRAAAAAPAPAPSAAGDGRLGTTVASIGDPGEPGFWIKTPLVSERKSGRLVYIATGRSVQVQLIPSGGPAGGGSQVSLAAMRLLDAPIDGLPEIVVYAN